jgi:hypothetical protein
MSWPPCYPLAATRARSRAISNTLQRAFEDTHQQTPPPVAGLECFSVLLCSFAGDAQSHVPQYRCQSLKFFSIRELVHTFSAKVKKAAKIAMWWRQPR